MLLARIFTTLSDLIMLFGSIVESSRLSQCPTIPRAMSESTPATSSLIDGGANGGMAGKDVTVLLVSSFNNVNVAGIGESLIQNLTLAPIAGLVHTQRGPAVVIMNQYANFGKGHTIHSASQLRAFGTLVHEAPRSAMVVSSASLLGMDTISLSPTVLACLTWICAPSQA